MKPESMNPKAREALGKSLIDIGVAIFKSLMLLVTVVPLAALLKVVYSSPPTPIDWSSYIAPLSGITGFATLVFLLLAFLLAGYLRNEGIRHIHEMEEKFKDNAET